jgi:DNA repair exonuclease SbcCD ATPase subunit
VIIRRMRVRCFRKLADQDVTFTSGLNVVRGRNDAGKSTLHLAFSAALFPVRPSEAKSYRPWSDGETVSAVERGAGEVTVDFEANGRRYDLRKDFGSQRAALRSEDEVVSSSKEIARRVAEFLGFESAALFRATAHIGQWQLAAVQDESREIGAHLSRIMTGTDGDAVRVLRAVADWVRRQEVGLRGRPASAPGALRRGQDRLRTLGDERQRLEADVKEIENAAAERERRAARIGLLEVKVAEDDALLAANRRLLELDRRWDEAGRRAAELAARLARIEEAARDLASAQDGSAQQAPDITEDTLVAVQQMSARASVLRQQLAEAEGQAQTARAGAGGETNLAAGSDARVGRGRADATSWRLAAVAGGLGAAGILLIAAHHETAAIVALAAAAILGLGSFIDYGRRAERLRLAQQAYHDRIAAADRSVASLREQASGAAAEVKRALEGIGVPTIEAAVARRTAAREAHERRQSAAQLLQGLLAGESRDVIANVHRQAMLELGAIQAQRDDPDLALRRLDAAAFQRLQLEAQGRRDELEREKAAVQRLEGRLAGRSPHEALARVEEELAETEARLARQQRQVEALRLTYDVLDRAHRATIVPGRARLEELASGYLRRLSAGAYDRIAVDEQTLAPRVWVGGPKEWADVSAREIGSGGVDQCYLALRLALVDLLADGCCPPLFLDDPFLAYDDERQASAMAFLRSLARDRQIFLFTCRTVYDEYADHVVVLDPLVTA